MRVSNACANSFKDGNGHSVPVLPAQTVTLVWPVFILTDVLSLNSWMKGRIETYTTLEYDSIGLLCYCEGSSMEISKHDSLIRLGRLNGTFQRFNFKYFLGPYLICHELPV